MRIQYKANGMQRTVRDVIGKVLVARGIARAVDAPSADDPAPGEYLRADMQPESLSMSARDASEVETAKFTSEEIISPRTGKPKRRYKRRDMQAGS
jgi:hypothetical protein